MSVKKVSIAVAAIAFGAYTSTSQANNDYGRGWAPNQPANPYRQAPNWPAYNTQGPAGSAPPAYRRPANQGNNYPAANDVNRGAPPPPSGPYRGTPPPRNTAPVQQQSQQYQPGYRGAPAPRPPGAYNEPSAFYTPGYNPYRDNRRNNNSWGGNKFWGRSGPSTWMNPNKQNWENGWDDMINAPSRMGEMPGGWSAPEVSVPNPVDMGDQMQDNMQDLPDQMRDGNIGNDVSN